MSNRIIIHRVQSSNVLCILYKDVLYTGGIMMYLVYNKVHMDVF